MLTDERASHRSNSSTSSIASSTRNGGSRLSPAPQIQSPQVESAVTRLLVAIKQLLEALTLWSTGKMTENQVSDVYVRLGNDFNAAVAAFAAFNIDMKELLGVPADLRTVLEEALAHDATSENLEKFLPVVREIITGLLQGLRSKQSTYRQVISENKQQRRLERHERQDSNSSNRPSRSSAASQPPRPPPPNGEAPSTAVLSQIDVASAVPSRVSGSSRRKGSVTPRGHSVLSETGGDARGWVGGFAPPRGQATVATSGTSHDVMAELLAETQPTEPRLSRAPLGSTSRRSPALSAQPQTRTSLHSGGSDYFDTSARPASSSTLDLEDTPPPPTASQSFPPEMKRYSLVDKPVPSSPPEKSAINGAPVVVVEAATPTPTPGSGGPTPDLGSPPTAQSSPGDAPLPPEAPAADKSLAALQQSEALARKASKRFSTFTISKMAGMGASGSSAGSKPSLSSKPSNRRSIAPSASIGQLSSVELDALAEVDEPTSPTPAKTRGPTRSKTVDDPIPAWNMPEEAAPPVPPLPPPSATVDRSVSPVPAAVNKDARIATDGPVTQPTFKDEPSRPPAAPPSPLINVFLQIGRQVKKVQIDTDAELSFASMRVLFVDCFSYNPGQDDFPAIYIRDPKSGVQYELEDVDEVKDGCLLSLNIEPLDQLKQHIDLQMASLTQDIKELKTTVANNRRMSLSGAGPINGLPPPSTTASPQAPRPTELQFQQAARHLMKFKSDSGKIPALFGQAPKMQPLVEQHTGGTPQPLVAQSTGGSSYTLMSEGGGSSRILSDLKTQFDEVQGLRRDLGVMRQLYLDFVNQTKESLGTLRSQTLTVRDLANQKVGGARAYIDSGKSKLDSRSQNVLTKLEELQDTVENLKADVLKRHVTPRANLVKSLKADIESSKVELESLKQHLLTIKPMWKKTWEEELQNIVEEQQFLNHQEELVEDLMEDHTALARIFDQIEQVITFRGGSNPGSKGFGKVLRTGKPFRPTPPEEGHTSHGTVMMEIRGALVDPEKRMKAIEANQKQRAREQQAKQDEFERELGDFVDQKKLKMTGGAEEVERIRQRKNDLALKAMFSPNALGGPTEIFGDDAEADGGGDGGGLSGFSFAKAPALDEDEPFDMGGGGGGFSGFSFSKAPSIPDSP